jgi:hypothetical protein
MTLRLKLYLGWFLSCAVFSYFLGCVAVRPLKPVAVLPPSPPGLPAKQFAGPMRLLVIPPAPSPVTVTVQVNPDPDASLRLDVWGSTNLVTWYAVTNVAGHTMTLTRPHRFEFYKARYTWNGLTGDWARKRI